jgi:phosphatidylinositol alpha-mannosyltransferase
LVIPKVRQFLKSRAPFDVVHLHEPYVPFLGPSFLAFATGLKLATFHTWRRGPHLPYIAFWPLLQLMNLPLNGRVAVSEFARSTIKRYVPGDYRIIPNGTNYERFAQPAPTPCHLRDDRPTILFVGRLEARKGIGHLLHAFQKLQSNVRNARLVLIGEGGLRAQYEKLALSLGLEDVQFQGYVSDEELPAYYQRADIVCAPSTTNESFGITLVEAMASGTAVVASRMGGYAQVATDQLDAILVEPGDVEGMADAFQRLLEDTALRERLIENGRLRARDFDWPNVASQLLAYYQELTQDERVAARPAVGP